MSELVEEPKTLKLRYPDIEINRLVSEPLKITELKDGESAIYRLVIADYKDLSRLDQKDKPLNSSPGRKMSGTTTIYDPVTKKKIKIRNIESYRTIVTEFGEKEVPVVKRFHFPKGGQVSVIAEQRETYAWLERHDGNRDNPFRDRSKPVLFYRVNNAKQAIKDMENNLVLMDALEYVNKADFIKLKMIYENMDKSAKQRCNPGSFETLKRDIFNYTKEYPILVMKCIDSKVDDTANTVKLKIQMMEAEHFNIIKFDDGDNGVVERGWYFIDAKMSQICEVELAVHKIDGLIEHFKTEEGKVNYKKVMERLKQVLTPR